MTQQEFWNNTKLRDDLAELFLKWIEEDMLEYDKQTIRLIESMIDPRIFNEMNLRGPIDPK